MQKESDICMYLIINSNINRSTPTQRGEPWTHFPSETCAIKQGFWYGLYVNRLVAVSRLCLSSKQKYFLSRYKAVDGTAPAYLWSNPTLQLHPSSQLPQLDVWYLHH